MFSVGTGLLDHVLGDGRFSDFNTEFEQFAMDARRTPEPVGPAHLADEFSSLLRDRWSTTSRP